MIEQRIGEAQDAIDDLLKENPTAAGTSGRELALAKTKLDEARLWVEEAARREREYHEHIHEQPE